MNLERAGGVLLHPTSLPGDFGIGDLGPAARTWLDFLAGSGCGLWQVLPLGPTGFGDSPYQCFSAFAGNPYLISPEMLAAEGLLQSDDLAELPGFRAERVDYGTVIPWKLDLLRNAYRRFRSGSFPGLEAEFEAFCSEHAGWLHDFALFMAIKEDQVGAPWVAWPAPLRRREAAALKAARRQHAESIERHSFQQFLFFRQWQGLHARAAELGIRIIGDIPIFVAHDSADVWARPDLYDLNEEGQPNAVAGVPPDYFSPTGQLWGNPLYRWERHAAEGYRWWLERLRVTLQLVDIVRLDHFRGFAGYWAIPAGAPTAETGRWQAGPGASFFEAARCYLGDLPIIAEDLGEITPDVVALREQFGLPGMKVLVFAFSSGPENEFLPHNYPPNCVVYTGTHDNDTVMGWFRRAADSEQNFCRRYLDLREGNAAWALVRAAWASVAVYALAPLQDILGLGNVARMNYPGRMSGNWAWRMAPDAMNRRLSDRLAELSYLFGRARSDPSPDL